MTREEFIELKNRMDGLVIFRGLLEDPVIANFRAMLHARSREDGSRFAAPCAAFEAALFEHGDNWSEYLLSAVLDSENVCIRRGRDLTSPVLTKSLESELAFLDRLAQVRLEDLLAGLEAAPDFLTGWAVSPCSVAGSYRARMAEADRYGWGAYARHHMFYLAEGRIVPVRHPDRTRLSDLVGYQRERETVLENTRALLAGRPAANVLLSGDAGTGKSSTVKAIINELYPQGLRVIEIRKDQLRGLPDLLDELSENPLKFILFIDDLSFQKGDDNYSALKAALEGSVSARSRNVVIYATSNRRHLVKETFSDREGDDVHLGETMQEMVSLSERFGLHVTFQKPDKAAYLHIVRHLAGERGIDCPDLERLAEQFALGRGGRSPRAARQFVDSLSSRT